MKRLTKKEKIEGIKKATKEIQDCIDIFSDNGFGLKRFPTVQELTMWQIEITRGVLTPSKKVFNVLCDLVDSYFILTNAMMEKMVKDMS